MLAVEPSTRNSKGGKLESLKTPVEPTFFFCRNYYGRGKVHTTEGKQLIEFIRFWLNPNY